MDNISYKENVKSRKEYRCSGCSEIWPIGTLWHVQVNCDQGDIWSWRECPVCQEIKRLPSFDYDDCQYEGEYTNYDEYEEIQARIMERLGVKNH